MNAQLSNAPDRRSALKRITDAREAKQIAAGPQATNPGITLPFALDVFRRWWKIAITAGCVLATLAATGVYFLVKPAYQAKALLWIDPQQPYLVEPERYANREFVANQVGLIASSLVLAPVVGRPEIARLPELNTGWQEPIDALREMIEVDEAWGGEHYHISCTYSNPAQAAQVANAVAESYLALVSEYEAGQTNRLIELLERERQASERQVELLRETVRQMTIDQTGLDPYAAQSPSESTPPHPLAGLQVQLTTVGVEQSVLRAQVAALQEDIAKQPSQVPQSMIDRVLDQDEQIRAKVAAVTSKRALLEDTKAKAVQGENSPRHQALTDEIRREEEMLLALRKSLGERVKRDLTATLDGERRQKLVELQGRLEEFKVREQVLKQSHEQQLATVQQYSGETLKLAVKRAELERANLVLDRIAERAFLLRTEQRAPARVQLVEKATIPIYPLEILPFKGIGLACFAGFGLPFLLVLLWDLRSRHVTSADQLQHQERLRVLGEVPILPTSPRRSRSLGSRRVKSRVRMFEETVDSLRTSLILSKSLQDVQVLAVTSAISGEGKTTIAAQLAMSIARATNEPTLLVAGDMRSPDVHQVFEIENETGLVQFLEHASSLADAAVASWQERLHVLPAGHLHSSPHRLLGNGGLKALLEEARPLYRHIVIDTPPVLVAGETMVIAAAADATILCTMRDVSRHEQVRRAYERLVEADANVVGCVFSGVSLREYRHRYGRYEYGQAAASEWPVGG